jgi:hypothetical protein
MMSDETPEVCVEFESGHNLSRDEFIKASLERLSRLFERAVRGDREAFDTLCDVNYLLKRAFIRTAPVAIQRALELRSLKRALAQVVKPSASNKTGSMFRGSVVIDEKCTGYPLYAEAKRWANSRMTLKSLARRVFNSRLEQEGRPTLEKSQFDADEQQLERWEDEQRRHNPSHLHYAPPAPRNADELKEHCRKMFSGEQYDSLEDIEAVYVVEQTWKKRKIDRRRAKG